MRKSRFFILFFLMCFILCTSSQAETNDRYRITKVIYDIQGATLEYPLTQAVHINTETPFPDIYSFLRYLSDIKVQFSNQRVFETTSIDAQYGLSDAMGIIPVTLTIHTIDTWNIIALPYPKYDSNTGFEFKLKLKDYNFFGSMQVLTGDLIYKIDENNKKYFASNLDFSIPFKAWNLSSNWNNELSIVFPQNDIDKPELNASTGFNIAFPVGITTITVGITQSVVLNNRNEDGQLYSQDSLYLNDKMYAYIPFVLYSLSYLGDITWEPVVSVAGNWSMDGIDTEILKGPVLSLGHSLEVGRFDWLGNFRSGFLASLANDYKYNIHHADTIDISIDGSITGYTTFYDRFGINGRLTGFYDFNYDTTTESSDVGEKIRGILNERIDTDTAFTLNIDIPIRVMRVNFQEITGVKWTRYIGFELHASPFFDMALTHDNVTGKYYSFHDAWYSGGMEIIIYPMKMRSIYGRISLGYDIAEVIKNGGNLSGTSTRDEASINEFVLGIGLHY